MTVTAEQTVPGTSRAELLRYAGSVEQASEHAVAAAITAHARAGDVPLGDAGGFTALPGLGARGLVDGHEVLAGRARLFADRGVEVPGDLTGWCRDREQAGGTTVLVAWDGVTRGLIMCDGFGAIRSRVAGPGGRSRPVGGSGIP